MTETVTLDDLKDGVTVEELRVLASQAGTDLGDRLSQAHAKMARDLERLAGAKDMTQEDLLAIWKDAIGAAKSGSEEGINALGTRLAKFSFDDAGAFAKSLVADAKAAIDNPSGVLESLGETAEKLWERFNKQDTDAKVALGIGGAGLLYSLYTSIFGEGTFFNSILATAAVAGVGYLGTHYLASATSDEPEVTSPAK